ncbi:hypothetical protein AB0L40_11415 [Patulibacter sp. NPDC049589]|uniref:hypothetical protein n=1 Tax=Patulibacter sp. NPDC049589 TaxID=3154731 RepID=UPI003426C271
MLRALVPGEVRAIERFGDDPAASVFPEEFVAVRHAVETRRREFVTGRACAHRALAALGVPVVPIMSGPNREPLWPEGVVGSITHGSG